MKTKNARALSLENKQDNVAHKIVVRDVSDILQAGDEVFKPHVYAVYDKIGFISDELKSRSYVGVTFHGMVHPEELDQLRKFMDNRGYEFLNVIGNRYQSPTNEKYKDDSGVLVRFMKTKHYDGGSDD